MIMFPKQSSVTSIDSPRAEEVIATALSPPWSRRSQRAALFILPSGGFATPVEGAADRNFEDSAILERAQMLGAFASSAPAAVREASSNNRVVVITD